MPYADVGAALEQSMVSWPDLRWIRDAWKGPIVVKGVHTEDDARRAVDAGANAIVVSNHGGRQLDGVAPTLRVLPEVLAAVNGQVEVLLDGGIRRGGDIAKALCLGARAVLVGRAYAYGLGAGGGPGRHAGDRDSAVRSRSHAQAAWLQFGGGTRSVVCGHPIHLERSLDWRRNHEGHEEASFRKNLRVFVIFVASLELFSFLGT